MTQEQTTGLREVLITGAGQGLGRATALRFGERGYRVWAVDLDGDSAAETAEAVNQISDSGSAGIACDVTDAEALAGVASRFERLDALINNAGIYRGGFLTEVPAADIDAVLAVNLRGVLDCIRAFAPALKAAAGAIVNLSSVAAVTNSPEFGIYPVTKVAVEGLTKQLALELGPSGVRVNCVGPGFIRTEGTDASYRGAAADRRAQGVPLGRLGTPGDVADVIAYLCSPQASYLTGQVLYVDGGLSAGRPGG